jgi:hypothetical protein
MENYLANYLAFYNGSLVGSIIGMIISIIIGNIILDYGKEILSGMLFLLRVICNIGLLFLKLVDYVFFNNYFKKKCEAFMKKLEAEEDPEFEKRKAEVTERCKKGIHNYFRLCCVLRKLEELEKQKR